MELNLSPMELQLRKERGPWISLSMTEQSFDSDGNLSLKEADAS